MAVAAGNGWVAPYGQAAADPSVPGYRPGTRTPGSGCAPVTAEELQVTLPHQGRSAFVPVRIPVCSERGRVSLSVQAIQARPGVPGYPMMP